MRSWSTLLRRRSYGHLAEHGLDWLWANGREFEITKSRDDDIPWQVKPLVELIFLLTVLRRNGFECSIADKLADHAVNAANDIRFFEGMDRLPYRQMDFAYSLGVVGIRDYEPYLASWFANTACGRGQHLARYSIGDLYSLTHAIFCLTDVGLNPTTPGLDGVTDKRMRRHLIRLTGMMVRADNLDVLGELLLCCLMCRLDLEGDDGLIFRWAFQVLEARIVFRAGLKSLACCVAAAGGFIRWRSARNLCPECKL